MLYTIKNHDFTQYKNGKDYFLDPTKEEKEVYMTGQGTNIKPGDYLILFNNFKPIKYLIKKIDYYSNYPYIWIALLREVSNKNY